jgi:hypothetical protein
MNARAPLKITALEQCWEHIHPDVVHVPQCFAGYPYWMVFTPYPSAKDRFENPTIRASRDGIHWQRIPGMPDPLVPSPTKADSHHADPELVYAKGRLHVIYLTICDRSLEVTFNAMSCETDLRWSEPEIIHKDVGAVSPTFQVDGSVLYAWFIRVNPKKPGRSELVRRDGPNLSCLRNECKCYVDIPGYVAWHTDVLKVGGAYEALIAAFPRGADNSRTGLFHLSSTDGLTFKLSRNIPIIKPSSFGWDNRMIYRSSFLKEKDGQYRIWYSAGSWGYHCGIGLLQGRLDSLKDPAIALAPVPRYITRLPGELLGWATYEIRRNFPASLLSLGRTMLSSNRQRNI